MQLMFSDIPRELRGLFILCLIVFYQWFLLFQKYVRSFIHRRRYTKLKRGVIRLQALVRGALLRIKIKHWHRNATKIQHKYQGYRKTKQQRDSFISFKKAVILIQNEWREWKYRQGVEYNW